MTKIGRCVNSGSSQSNRKVKQIAPKALIPSKRHQENDANGLPIITTLPAEILDDILGIVLKDGMLESLKRRTPNIGLRQYRTLIKTCKLFKAVVDNAYFKVTIQCIELLVPGRYPFAQRTRILVVSPWGNLSTADIQKRVARFCCPVV